MSFLALPLIGFLFTSVAQDAAVPASPSPATPSPTPTPTRIASATCVPEATEGDIGIHVDCPKLYDNRALELMLAAAQQDLARLKLIDQAGIAKQIGALQGGTATETSLNVQASGLPTPQTTRTLTTSNTSTNESTVVSAPTGVTTTTKTGTTPSSTDTQGTTRNAVVPSIPTSPALSGASSLGTNYSSSASDTLNEQMQLTYEIANLRMLLEGSLSDHFIGTSQASKRRATIGFPISIEPPREIANKRVVAEVAVLVTNPPPAPGSEASSLKSLTMFRNSPVPRPNPRAEPPGLVAILPRERTYNTAHITDSQKGFAGAAVLNVVNLGAAWSSRTKTFYILQDVDTVALQRSVPSPHKTSDSIAFVWQFRPVLNQPAVRGGLRQTFVQLAFPIGPADPQLGTVTVTVRWRDYDPKTRAVGNVKYWRNPVTRARGPMEATAYSNAPLTNFDLTPDPQLVTVEALDQAHVSVHVAGDFLPDTYVRIGDVILDEYSKTLWHDTSGLRFVVPASLLLEAKVVIVARDGSETRLGIPSPGCGGSGPKDVVALSSDGITARPHSATDSLVTVALDEKATTSFPGSPLLVDLAGTVYGLPDLPLRSVTKSALTLIAPTERVRAAGAATVGHLLCGLPIRAPISVAAGFGSAKLVKLAADADATLYALTGGELASREGSSFKPLVEVYAIRPQDETDLSRVSPLKVDGLSTDTVLFRLTKEAATGVKQLLLRDARHDGYRSWLALGTAPPTPEVKPIPPIARGPGRSIVIAGSNLEEISRVTYQGRALRAERSLDNSSLIVALPDELTDHVGPNTIVLQAKDKSELSLTVSVVDSAPSR